MFDFKNQDVIGDYYVFRKSTYNRESAEATRLRGVGGVSVNGDLEEAVATTDNVQSNYRQASLARFHKVSRGESLYSIARKRGTSVAAICKLNHIRKNARLRPGQILRYN